MTLSRRALLATPALLALARNANAATTPLRIGYQKNGALVILRRQATLDPLFAPTQIQWTEFNAGPPMLEALAAGAIEIASTGDTPPIFAQAANADLLYLGAQPLHGNNQAIIVRADSPIRSIADLAGKKIAFTRGSSAHNLVIKALAKANLTLADIQPVPMQPADAMAAFRAGALDAWAVWDPFLAIAQQSPTTRVLVNSPDIAPTSNFILGRGAWARNAPTQVTTLLAAINQAASWATAHPNELAELMAEITGVPLPAQRLAAPRGVYAVQPLTAEIIAQQQDIADTFTRLKIIPAKIDITKAIWRAQA